MCIFFFFPSTLSKFDIIDTWLDPMMVLGQNQRSDIRLCKYSFKLYHHYYWTHTTQFIDLDRNLYSIIA